MNVNGAVAILDVRGDGLDARQVRDAWRRFARAHHPDRCPGDPSAAERFAAGRQAYEVLRARAEAVEAAAPAELAGGRRRAVLRGEAAGGYAPASFPRLGREWRA